MGLEIGLEIRLEIGLDRPVGRWHRRRRGQKGRWTLRIENVSEPLSERLGIEATVGLVETLSVARREWEDDVIGRAIERFEQRLTNQVADLKIAVGGVQATLREEMAAQKVELLGLVTRQGAELRQAIVDQGAEFRVALAGQDAQLRQAIGSQGSELREAIANQGAELRAALATQGADLRSEMAAGRTDLLRWLFVFWTGQLIALAALLKTLG